MARLVNVATDGESYGHHFKFGDRCLAYALEVEAPRSVASMSPTTARSSRIIRRATRSKSRPAPMARAPRGAASTASARWQRNCGCHTGGEAGWNQEWRAPLRAAFDLLRDECAIRFEEMGAKLFRDPWKARDDFIEVILNRAAAHDSFLGRHGRHKLDGDARLRALTLLEMQRNAMLMYTSCGWFFNELSGIETVQTMKYAGHAMDLMESLGLRAPRDRFLEVLARQKATSRKWATAPMSSAASFPRRGHAEDGSRRIWRSRGWRITASMKAGSVTIFVAKKISAARKAGSIALSTSQGDVAEFHHR